MTKHAPHGGTTGRWRNLQVAEGLYDQLSMFIINSCNPSTCAIKAKRNGSSRLVWDRKTNTKSLGHCVPPCRGQWNWKDKQFCLIDTPYKDVLAPKKTKPTVQRTKATTTVSQTKNLFKLDCARYVVTQD